MEGGEIDRKKAHCRNTNGYGGRDPVDGRSQGPREHEESDGQKSYLYTAKIKPSLWCRGQLAIVTGNFLLIDTEDGGEDGPNDHCCDDCQYHIKYCSFYLTCEDGASLFKGEAMICLEN